MSTSAVRAGSAFVEVGLKSDLSAGARRIQAQLAGISASFKTMGSGLAAAGASATAAFGGILAALAWPTKLAADMEVTRASFQAMLGDAQKVKTLLADLQKFGAETPFQFPELADAARKLMAFGVSAEDVIDTLRNIGDVSSGIGAPLGEIAEIFGKAKVQGRLFMEDINQLTGRGIPIFAALAKQFGVTEGEIRGMVEKGQINFSHLGQAFKDLTATGGQFAGQMAAKSKTLIGLFSTLMDSISAAVMPVGEALVEALKPVVTFAGLLIKPIGEFLSANAGVVAAVGAIAAAGTALGVAMMTVGGALFGVGSAIGGVVALWPAFIAGWGAITAAIVPLIPVIAAVAGGLLAVGATYAGILYLANQAGILKTVFDGVSATFNELGKTVGRTFAGMTRALNAGEYTKAAQILWAGIKLAFFQGAKAAFDAFTWLFNNGLSAAVSFAKALGQTIWNVFKAIPEMLANAVMGGATLAEILAKAISGGMGNALNQSIADAQVELNKLTAQDLKGNAGNQPGKGPGPAKASDAKATSEDEGKKAFEDRLKALQDETMEMKLGADAFDLYKLKLQGVGDEQRMQIQALQQYRDRLKNEAKAKEDAAKAAEDAAKKAADDRKDLMERGKQMTDEVRLPFQVMEDKIKEINMLQAAGAISSQTAGLQREAARNDFNAPMRDAMKNGRNTIALKDTQAAMDIVLRTRASYAAGAPGKNKLEDTAQSQLDELRRIREDLARNGGGLTVNVRRL